MLVQCVVINLFLQRSLESRTHILFMIVSSAYRVGVLWIGLAERELDGMLYCCLVTGRYLSIINTEILVHLHHPLGDPIVGEAAV